MDYSGWSGGFRVDRKYKFCFGRQQKALSQLRRNNLLVRNHEHHFRGEPFGECLAGYGKHVLNVFLGGGLKHFEFFGKVGDSCFFFHVRQL